MRRQRTHRRNHRDARHGGSNRGGLSLIEMMLAVGLGLLLVGGMYSAIDQSARQQSIGRVEMERMQIARAVLRRIELDLRPAFPDCIFKLLRQLLQSGRADVAADALQGMSEPLCGFRRVGEQHGVDFRHDAFLSGNEFA